MDTNDQDQVVGFREKVEVPYWINAGIYIFDRRIEEELPQLGDHEDRTFPRLAREGCDMKSSQSLLCATFGPDTTRCPISGILRRCAGR